ncbi:hypothetical protein Y900_017785 [Mycolicibacterium aromaticivorans JS19b1 = JCM 16368]|uniref:Uncharacterized protein n=1 Tax=Mycolicibacterium aromaticivorans JS19b1 = JCM 16368 TaxID=1440774 RepID=Z5X5U5_9MYCO|nr:hypothetical protein [Mycolicibacterium aromaticivorans]KDF00735.1 hypothetical protein Y900_017785 [Mycolicibacterium aromaticivorans JS19b1 = JCM 16368]
MTDWANLGDKVKLSSIFHSLGIATIFLTAFSFGGGIAGAVPDWSGQAYGKASKEISQYGYTAAIASVVGDQVPLDDCLITRSSKASKLNSSGRSPGTEILLHLDCFGKLAEPGKPGNSAASPEGRQTKNDLLQLEYFNINPDKCAKPLDVYCKMMCTKYLDHCSAAVQHAIAAF